MPFSEQHTTKPHTHPHTYTVIHTLTRRQTHSPKAGIFNLHVITRVREKKHPKKRRKIDNTRLPQIEYPLISHKLSIIDKWVAKKKKYIYKMKLGKGREWQMRVRQIKYPGWFKH